MKLMGSSLWAIGRRIEGLSVYRLQGENNQTKPANLYTNLSESAQ